MSHQIAYLHLSTESHFILYVRLPLVSVKKGPNFPAQMNTTATTAISLVHSNLDDYGRSQYSFQFAQMHLFQSTQNALTTVSSTLLFAEVLTH